MLLQKSLRKSIVQNGHVAGQHPRSLSMFSNFLEMFNPSKKDTPSADVKERKKPHKTRRSKKNQMKETTAAPEVNATVTPASVQPIVEKKVENVVVRKLTPVYTTGEIATLASGAVFAQWGNSVVLTTAVSEFQPKNPDTDFLPLMVDYREKYYSSGRVPESFRRRELAGQDADILNSRVIDRIIRPLFPAKYVNDTQLICTVQSYDPNYDPVVLAVNSASAALAISDIPWDGLVGCVRVGELDGEFVLNPSKAELHNSSLDLLLAINEDGKCLMIEASGNQISDERMKEAFHFAQKSARAEVKRQRGFVKRNRKEKRNIHHADDNTDREKIEEYAKDIGFDRACEIFRKSQTMGKTGRQAEERAAYDYFSKKLMEKFPSETKSYLQNIAHELVHKAIRHVVLTDKEPSRCDGRMDNQIREIKVKRNILPSTHGSSLFTRGDTQTLCTATLAPTDQALKVYSATIGDQKKSAMLHYEFPPYCVNETGRIGGFNRRMIGHGNLAEKAILPVLPSLKDFPFTVRMTSEVTGSDGSSSMATVCGVCTALQDAGVPISDPVAGISVGLFSSDPKDSNEKPKYKLLTDILGIEDHFGDMDFKIAGTKNGITAIQLDVKPAGIPIDVLCDGLDLASEARLKVLDKMNVSLAVTKERNIRDEIPISFEMKIDPSKRGAVIGTGGSVIRDIELNSNCSISLDSEGKLQIFGKSVDIEKAKKMIDDKLFEFSTGVTYKLVVRQILDFGAVLEDPTTLHHGFLHISELDHSPVSNIHDHLKLEQELQVVCIAIDRNKGVKLSRKQLFHPETLEELNADDLQARLKQKSIEINSKRRRRKDRSTSK